MFRQTQEPKRPLKNKKMKSSADNCRARYGLMHRRIFRQQELLHLQVTAIFFVTFLIVIGYPPFSIFLSPK